MTPPAVCSGVRYHAERWDGWCGERPSLSQWWSTRVGNPDVVGADDEGDEANWDVALVEPPVAGPFWTTVSPRFRTTSAPLSSSRHTSPSSTTVKSIVAVVCIPGASGSK
jgi:hypothetical protein